MASEDALNLLLSGLGINDSSEATLRLARALHEAQEATFVATMRGIAATASDASSSADEARRGAPTPTTVPVAILLESQPPLAVGQVAAAWGFFRAAVSAAVWPPPGTKLSSENKHMHPVIEMLLAACIKSQAHLRLFRNQTAHDDIVAAAAQPDFIVTHARDSQASLLGAALMVEVELPSEMGIRDAELQARAFARRRVYKLFMEARDRNEAGDAVSAVVAGTNGRLVTISRVRSGAPPPGGLWQGRQPCPAISTQRLELLAGWDGVTCPALPESPPAGFEALVRVLHAPASAFSVESLPLASIRVRWDGSGTDTGAAITLGDRIGRGGSSDVYAAAAGPGGGSCALKLGRCSTSAVLAAYVAESTALRQLSATVAVAQGLVPRLQRRGERVLDRVLSQAVPSPVLELAPCGVPLEDWLRREAAAVVAAALERGDDEETVARARRQFLRDVADDVVSRVVAALACAHSVRVVHCDVRPSNVVVVDGRAMLVDWGASREMGAEGAGVGVAAYADAPVFAQDSFTSRPCQDLVPAALLWLSIARGGGCAPWLSNGRAVAGVLAARDAWLSAAAADEAASSAEEGAARVASVARFVQAASGAPSKEDLLARARVLWPPPNGACHGHGV